MRYVIIATVVMYIFAEMYTQAMKSIDRDLARMDEREGIE